MGLQLSDKWVWDFWLAEGFGKHHIFYLQAPRSLGHPSLRHHNASIGHAFSDDWESWQVLPDALRPGPAGSWDDLATWTGSVIAHDGRWSMLYTGICRAEGGLVQRVGLATSGDLVHWEKHPDNPVLEAAGIWYERSLPDRWRDLSWRDPYLFQLPEDESFHVLITARAVGGDSDGAGVLAHCRSADLVHWEVLPPLTAPGEFAQVEVPQLVGFGDCYIVLFSCHAEDHSSGRLSRLGAPGVGGTFAFFSKEFSGPYVPGDSPVTALGDGREVLYAGKFVDAGGGDWMFMGFGGDSDADFTGDIRGPFPVKSDAHGRPSVLVSPRADETVAPGTREPLEN